MIAQASHPRKAASLAARARMIRCSLALVYLIAQALSLCTHQHGHGSFRHSHLPGAAGPPVASAPGGTEPLVRAASTHTHGHDPGACPACHFRTQPQMGIAPVSFAAVARPVETVARVDWPHPLFPPVLRLACRAPPGA